MYYERNMPMWSRGFVNQQPQNGFGYPFGYPNNPFNNFYIQQQRQQEELIRRQNNQQVMMKLHSIASMTKPEYERKTAEQIYREQEKLREMMCRQYEAECRYCESEMALSNIDPNYESPDHKAMRAHNHTIREKNEKYFKKEDDLYDLFNKSGEIVQNMLIEEHSKFIRDTTQMYNNNWYRQSLNVGGNMYRYNPNMNRYDNIVNIDDESITLPRILDNEYARRKQEFLNSIISKSDV